MRRICGFLLALAFVLGFGAAASAADRIGVVLMHGKWGGAAPQSPLGRLAVELEGAGFLVAVPEMPWSRSRYLAKDYEESMAEIDLSVARLKEAGATRIVVGGHSMGANAALGYGARRPGLAGIMALAPGHIPESPPFQASIGHDYRRAKAMVDGGRGDEEAEFADNNQGERKAIRAMARVYLSWFDPDGPASMPRNTANLKQGAPLLWLVGDGDSMAKRGRAYAFDKAPSHPNNAYVEISANHGNTPVRGARQIIDWLKRL